MFKTITSRFAGCCQRCKKAGLSPEQQAIKPGQKIRWARNAGAYHLSADCPASQGATVAEGPPLAEPAMAEVGPATDASWRRHLDVGFDCGDPSDAF